MDWDAFDVETSRRRGCGDLRASERNRAISLSDNPTGTGATGRKSGSTVGREEGDEYWSAIISASEFPIKKGCCSAEFPESSATSEEFGSKGVTIKCGPKSMTSFEEDRIDLGLDRLHFRRRFTKVTIPITAKMAAKTPPIVPPTIAPTLGERVVAAVPSKVIVLLGTLREGPGQE